MKQLEGQAGSDDSRARRTTDIATVTLVSGPEQVASPQDVRCINKTPRVDWRLGRQSPGAFLSIASSAQRSTQHNYAQVPQQTGVLLKQM